MPPSSLLALVHASFSLGNKFAQRHTDTHRQLLQKERGGDAAALLKSDDACASHARPGGESILAQACILSRRAENIREFRDKAFCRIGGQSRRNYDLTGSTDMSVLGQAAL